MGWTQRFTERTSATLLGGPRFTDGRVEPEVFASLDHRLQRGFASLTYTRTEATVVGIAGPAETDSVVASLTYEPVRFLDTRAAAAWRRIDSRTEPAFRIWDLDLSVGYRFTRWMALRGAYRFLFQEGGGGGDISRNVISISLELGYPIRVD